MKLHDLKKLDCGTQIIIPHLKHLQYKAFFLFNINNKAFILLQKNNNNLSTKLLSPNSIKFSIPSIFFTIGRMNPPTPAHIKGLLIPFFNYIASQIFINYNYNLKLFLNIFNKWVSNLSKPSKNENLFLKLHFSGKSNIPSKITSPSINLLSDFKYLAFSNIRFRFYLSFKSNAFPLFRILSSNNEESKLLLNQINNKSAFNNPNYKKVFENPLHPHEKTHFIKIMLKSVGIPNNIISTYINNSSEYRCNESGISSAIQCALDIQYYESGSFNPDLVYYLTGDNNNDLRIKFCNNNNINNDESPKINCLILPRIKVNLISSASEVRNIVVKNDFDKFNLLKTL